MRELTIWTEMASVGNREIDEQHKNLFRLGRETLRILEEHAHDVERAHEVLNDIAEALGQHFDFEEKLLARNACPLLERHVAEHNAYRMRLYKNLNQTAAVGIDKDGLLAVMRDWISKHVPNMDVLCKDYLK